MGSSVFLDPEPRPNEDEAVVDDLEEERLELPAAFQSQRGTCEYEEDCLCFDMGFACCA
jgi:hypothetical protein